jgi:phosphatidylserine/phosphatidylglycerophosphate/cardiolipin synthase-like enzyme
VSNGGITGVVQDENGAPLAGLVVGAFAVGGVFGQRLLANTKASGTFATTFPGYAETKADGSFEIGYASLASADLLVRVYDRVKRRLALDGVHSGVTATTFSLPAPIVIAGADATGLLVSGGEFPAPFDGNEVELLVDNAVAWKRVVQAIDGAQSSINFMLFYLDVGVSLMSFSPDPPTVGDPTAGPTSGRRLEAALLEADERGVAVRLLLNDFTPDLPDRFSPDSAGPVADYFASPPANSVEVRRFKTPQMTPIHAKVVVIDDSDAYVIGSPFIQDYFDAVTHDIDDPRHGSYFCLGPAQIRVPTHDVSLLIGGPAVAALNETFRLHWNTAKPSGAAALAAAPAPAARANGVSVQIARTLHGNGRFTSIPAGETAILEGYLRAIASAQNLIYLENQYFTCEEIADALVLAIKQRSGLEVIFLTNNKVDIPGYTSWQPDTIRRVLAGLTEEERKRVEFFTAWSAKPALQAGSLPRVARSYIHSKVAIVDDTWATVGSANLDGVSLTASQNAVRWPYSTLGGLFNLRSAGDLTQDRATEANVFIYSAVEGLAQSSLPDDLRRLLWAEHLGYLDGNGAPDPAASDLDAPPSNGTWLDLWRDRAGKKLDGLSPLGADPVELHPARVLRFPHDGAEMRSCLHRPRRYLDALGASLDRLDVRQTFRPFSFADGDYE